MFEGSYDEYRTLRKVPRCFIWHGRIYARAMYSMAVRIFSRDAISNVYFLRSGGNDG